MQGGRVEDFKREGDQHFTDDGRRAKITIDLLLQARAKNGLEDAVASEMIKQLPREKINIITKCFQERFMG